MRRALLLTLTEPPAHMEEEFNAWYDEEHLPERLAIPGFPSAQRWIAEVAAGAGKYLATYELDSMAVLSSAPYRERYENPTPWSRRCLGRALVFQRWACEQLEPGDADPHPAAQGLLFNAVAPGALQTRRFRAASGELITLCEVSELGNDTASGTVYRLYQP